ncbi:histone acetyltransferase HAC12 [Medicago truncatula]|uniref:histone acetyltransferase HAC12 n=1 Tax=Medicago truncatula TaxID=3880 RepID=UPI000D2F27CF|nr:histone acetyltransferase HAC12 [Medicago truncatula]
MLVKGCHLAGNTSSVVSNISRKRCFEELSNQLGFSTDWRYHPEMNEIFAPMLEISLLTNAASKEEYMNLETLHERVQALLGVPKSTFTFSQSASVNTSEFSTHDGNTEEFDDNFPDVWSCIDFGEHQPQKLDINHKRRKIMEYGVDVSLVNDASHDQPIHEMIPSKGLQASQISVGIDSMPTLEKDVIIIDADDDEEDIQGRTAFNQKGVNTNRELIIIDDDGEEEKDLGRHDIVDNISMEMDIGANSNMHAPIDVEDKQEGIGFNQEGTDAQKEVSEPKAEQEKQTKSTKRINDAVSLIDSFRWKQITEHVSSLRKESVQITSKAEARIDANTCQLCEKERLYFAPVPLFCLHCGNRIKRTYFCTKEDDFDAHGCICSTCYKTSKGGKIAFNGTSISKKNLEKRNNDEVLEEPWVECTKCERWQHQICALYNKKADLDCRAEYICLLCRLKEIENGRHVPSKAANYCAKDLTRTVLSDHLEKRLFERLLQERENWEKVEGNEKLDEVLAAENLSIREVLSVDKQLKVNKQFLDIIPEENYPTEFSYRSRVILLFQKIEGADVCIFGMYVQEFGSECSNPNQHCVYISYLDSVKYFRPERRTKSGEALRTVVYHEILIGYLDFCKKNGFSTCYIWSCAPSEKGDDYILYCHPEEQKTPKNDKLRRWYLSMLKKASEENIVVGLTNVYDRFFLPTEKWKSKVTASRLPYFDGDCWCGNAMVVANTLEKESRVNYEKLLKQVSNRTIKDMGHAKPSKDILVMQKVGQNILPTKENFLVAHLRSSCIHCHEVIVSGKRWFCTECKKFQECERCHSSEEHTSKNGEVHTLCQASVDDIPSDTKRNDIVLESELFENRDNFLIFCQKSQFQFDTLRRAKYSSMMILYHLHNPTVMMTQNEHQLSQNCSTPVCQSGNQESNEEMKVKLLNILKHASQCRATKSEPCSHPNCSQIKKLFSHASKCEIRVNGGCQHCKKIWFILTAHSRNCKDSECRIPRCSDLKKHVEQKSMHSES